MFRPITANKSSIGSKSVPNNLSYPLQRGFKPKMTADGRYVLTSVFSEDIFDFDGAVIIDMYSGDDLPYSISFGTGSSAYISSNEAYFAVTFPLENSSSGRVRIYNTGDGSLFRTISNPSPTIKSDRFGRDGVSFSGDGKRVAIGCTLYRTDDASLVQSRVFIYDVGTGDLIRTFISPTTGFNGYGAYPSLSSDGSIIAFGSTSNTYIFNVDTGGLITAIADNEYSSGNFNLSSDGETCFIKRSKYSAVNGSLLVQYSSDEAFSSGVMSADASTVIICSTTQYKIFRGSSTTPVEEGVVPFPQYYGDFNLACISADGSRIAIQGVGEVYSPVYEIKEEIIFKEY